MSAADEQVVRRFYEEMCNSRRNDLAEELFTDDHQMHDPQVPAGIGPAGMVEAVSAYQQGVDGHWQIEEIFSTDDRVVVRWTGTGTHVGTVNGVPATGRPIRVDALTVHRMREGRIAETHEVWDTLGFLGQIGALPGEKTALLQQGYEAFARQDIPGVLALFDPAISWYSPDTVEFGGSYTGRHGVAEFFSQLPEHYEELAVTPERFVEQGDTVVVLGRLQGRTKVGNDFDVPFAHIWTVAGGKATGFFEHFDTARMDMALGSTSMGIPGQAVAAEERLITPR